MGDKRHLFARCFLPAVTTYTPVETQVDPDPLGSLLDRLKTISLEKKRICLGEDEWLRRDWARLSASIPEGRFQFFPTLLFSYEKKNYFKLVDEVHLRSEEALLYFFSLLRPPMSCRYLTDELEFFLRAKGSESRELPYVEVMDLSEGAKPSWFVSFYFIYRRRGLQATLAKTIGYHVGDHPLCEAYIREQARISRLLRALHVGKPTEALQSELSAGGGEKSFSHFHYCMERIDGGEVGDRLELNQTYSVMVSARYEGSFNAFWSNMIQVGEKKTELKHRTNDEILDF